MDLGLKGKKAFVAGSSKGIGFAVAESLAREGSDLFLAARNGSLLGERAVHLKRTYGVDVSYSACDLSKLEGVQEAADTGLDRCKAFDILVANCGGPKAGTALETMDEESMGAGFNQTLLSTIRLVRRLLPGMREKKWGRIVAVTSVSVFEPIENLALSNTFRSGLTAFLKTLSNEAAADGITINAVCPGYTKTERLAEPMEIADAAVFLCSGRASYITGVSLPVDGGRLRGTLY